MISGSFLLADKSFLNVNNVRADPPSDSNGTFYAEPFNSFRYMWHGAYQSSSEAGFSSPDAIEEMFGGTALVYYETDNFWYQYVVNQFHDPTGWVDDDNPPDILSVTAIARFTTLTLHSSPLYDLGFFSIEIGHSDIYSYANSPWITDYHGHPFSNDLNAHPAGTDGIWHNSTNYHATSTDLEASVFGAWEARYDFTSITEWTWDNITSLATFLVWNTGHTMPAYENYRIDFVGLKVVSYFENISVPDVTFESNVTSLIWLLIVFIPAIAMGQYIPKIGFVAGLGLMLVILGTTQDGFASVMIIGLVALGVLIYKGV